jgi:hypothetical protein
MISFVSKMVPLKEHSHLVVSDSRVESCNTKLAI